VIYDVIVLEGNGVCPPFLDSELQVLVSLFLLLDVRRVVGVGAMLRGHDPSSSWTWRQTY
jgi:hypothetical protein